VRSTPETLALAGSTSWLFRQAARHRKPATRKARVLALTVYGLAPITCFGSPAKLQRSWLVSGPGPVGSGRNDQGQGSIPRQLTDPSPTRSRLCIAGKTSPPQHWGDLQWGCGVPRRRRRRASHSPQTVSLAAKGHATEDNWIRSRNKPRACPVRSDALTAGQIQPPLPKAKPVGTPAGNGRRTGPCAPAPSPPFAVSGVVASPLSRA